MPPRTLDAGLRLLDRQILDRDGRMAGKVDDLELAEPDGGIGPPYVSAILSGTGALAGRFHGRLRRVLEGMSRRLRERDEDRPARIPFELVTEVANDVRLRAPFEELEVSPLEDWVRDHLIGRIPGAQRAPK